MKIEKSKYQGYLWYSNESNPEIIDNKEFELEISDEGNPFVVEGQLFDDEKSRSISIKYVDGKYIIKHYDVQKGERENEQEYLSNRMDGRKLYFVQRWKENTDDLCEGMNVLLPSELVFVGFNKDGGK